ncbi:MAG: NAD(P)-dependent alcohol dehydrogenase [Spongiibacteraceae bacterium]
MAEVMIEVTALGGEGVNGISFNEVAIPQVGPGEVLVRLRAATLNYRDVIGLHGKIPGLTKKPNYVPLSCACGEVTAIGEGVSRVQLGDRVAPTFDQYWLTGGLDKMSGQHLGGSVDGVARQYAVFNQEGLVLVPDELSDLEVATLPCAGLTAWSALFSPRPIKPGETVLLQGTGGVSIAALQFAKAAGANVIITSSSDAKLRRAKLLGADHTINYRVTPDWAEEVLSYTNDRGADLIVDVLGGTQLGMCVRAAAPGGVISAVGMLDGNFSWGAEPGVPVAQISVGNREQFEEMLRGMVKNRIRPVVDRVYPLGQLKNAIVALETGQFMGKIAIDLS